jgi:ABC-type bacteriocin/lantibiotic exporter with double-glycine peptidase domain
MESTGIDWDAMYNLSFFSLNSTIFSNSTVTMISHRLPTNMENDNGNVLVNGITMKSCPDAELLRL